MQLEQQLYQGVADLKLTLPPAAEAMLLHYLELLAKWNQTYNLTAVRDPEEMVTRHLLDSLAVVPHVRGPRVIDIGTGPGLPGLPLAIALPELSFTLLDANGRMLRFVTQAVGELGLKNVEIVQSRVENYRPGRKFDTLISRAFSSIADMLNSARHLCAPNGRFLAMKGTRPEEELAAVPAEYTTEIVVLAVPGLRADRHLVILTPRP
jgi:16S rRNA (guanine527-N7)-methyltransferase